MMDLSNGKPPCLVLLLGLLLVHLLPGALGLTVTNTISNARPLLGETVILNCNIADGVANTTVSWWKDKTNSTKAVYVSFGCLVVSEAYKLRLTNIQCDKNHYNFQLSDVKESDVGEWQCEANGVQGTMLNLDVLVPHNVKVKIKKTTVKEDEFVRLECATSGGKPENVTRYQWLWKKSGSDAEQVIQDTPNDKFLELTRVKYNRSGTYSCKAQNDGGMGQASTVLNVQYSPKIDPESKMKYEVAAHVGGEALFELFIIANPTPVATGYIWSKDGNVTLHSSQDYEIATGPTFSKLKIKGIKPSDYKNYTCSVRTSGFEPQIFSFALLKADPLPAPSRLKGVTSTDVSATLEWISESPNGTEQRFYIQYKTFAEKWENALEVPQEGIIDPGLMQVVYHEIEDLKPNISYVFRVGSKASHSGPFISNFSNIVEIKTQDSNYDDKPKHYIHDAGLQTGLIGLIVGGVVVLILVAISLVAIIQNKKQSSSKKEGEALELQNNVVNGLVEGKFNKAMCPTPTRSECDPNENGKCYPNSAVGSPQNLTHIYATPRKPDVVSDTQAHVECLYQNVTVGKKGSQKGGRLSLRGSRSLQPTSHAEDCLYQNVNRNGQPQQYSGSGGVPKIIGVDGTVYAQLSFHGTSSPSTGHYDYPVRRTEVLTPYAVVNFRLKAPPLEDEDEVQYIT